MKYEVPIVYRGQCNFIVDAESAEKAAEIATAKFKDGQPPDELGNEWEEIERIGTVEEMQAPTVDEIIQRAESAGLTAAEVASKLGIDHDRLSNGGVAEVVRLVHDEGDDAKWIEEILFG